MGAFRNAVVVSVLSLLPGGAALKERQAVRLGEIDRLRSFTYQDFVDKYGRTYEKGGSEWNVREQLFLARLNEVIDFNSELTHSWSKGMSPFMDYSDREFQSMLGYKGRRRQAAAGTVDLHSQVRQKSPELPDSFSVRKKVGDGVSLTQPVRDQGMCGSCWAMAATSVLEGHVEKNETLNRQLTEHLHSKSPNVPLPTVSSQAMVSCTQNPKHCGGTGGCEGATVELAYELVKSQGLPLAADFPYKSGFGETPACSEKMASGGRLGIDGYVVLPSNKRLPLLEALFSTGGPVAVSADASAWMMYSGGIFSDQGSFTVNHAILLEGYKLPSESEKGYYVIKNSWGTSWGEDGHIRIEMTLDEDNHCGWDLDTHAGLACDGDPDKAWVCGTSGILYDSVYPTGLHFIPA